MKYISSLIILILLTSCFQKPGEENIGNEENTPVISTETEQNIEVGNSEEKAMLEDLEEEILEVVDIKSKEDEVSSSSEDDILGETSEDQKTQESQGNDSQEVIQGESESEVSVDLSDQEDMIDEIYNELFGDAIE